MVMQYSQQLEALIRARNLCWDVQQDYEPDSQMDKALKAAKLSIEIAWFIVEEELEKQGR